MLSRVTNIPTALMPATKVSLLCLKAQHFFSEAITGLDLFISGNSCDFIISRMFFVYIIYDTEKY